MTKTEIEATLAKSGWTCDRFGNYKSKTGKLRIRLQTLSVRIEKLNAYTCPYQGLKKEWLAVATDYYKNVVPSANGMFTVKRITLSL